jgi:hypothetical protein
MTTWQGSDKVVWSLRTLIAGAHIAVGFEKKTNQLIIDTRCLRGPSAERAPVLLDPRPQVFARPSLLPVCSCHALRTALVRMSTYVLSHVSHPRGHEPKRHQAGAARGRSSPPPVAAALCCIAQAQRQERLVSSSTRYICSRWVVGGGLRHMPNGRSLQLALITKLRRQLLTPAHTRLTSSHRKTTSTSTCLAATAYRIVSDERPSANQGNPH